MSKKITIDGNLYDGVSVATPNAVLLMILGTRGFLGCGYLNCAAAEKLGDAAAIVRGVKDFDDMLSASVVEVSAAAAALGVTVGMAGREALKHMA